MKTQLALIAGAMLLVFAAGAYAHHPFSAEYDWTKGVTLTGTVNKIEWTNPHAFLYVDAKDEKGNARQWKLEMGSPGALTRAGWTRNTVKMGDQVTVDAWMSKSANDRGNNRKQSRDQPPQPRTQPNIQKSFHHNLSGERPGEGRVLARGQ